MGGFLESIGLTEENMKTDAEKEPTNPGGPKEKKTVWMGGNPYNALYRGKLKEVENEPYKILFTAKDLEDDQYVSTGFGVSGLIFPLVLVVIGGVICGSLPESDQETIGGAIWGSLAGGGFLLATVFLSIAYYIKRRKICHICEGPKHTGPCKKSYVITQYHNYDFLPDPEDW